jgi:hypothetical protein
MMMVAMYCTNVTNPATAIAEFDDRHLAELRMTSDYWIDWQLLK